MFSYIKFLKIVLPVATVTSATIATVSLVSSRKEDAELDSNLEDKLLEDFEKQAEDFKEQIMLYAKDGKGDGVKVSSEEERQKLLEKFKKEGLQDDGRSKDNSVADPLRLNQQPQESVDHPQNPARDTTVSTSLSSQKSEDSPDVPKDPTQNSYGKAESDEAGKNSLDEESKDNVAKNVVSEPSDSLQTDGEHSQKLSTESLKSIKVNSEDTQEQNDLLDNKEVDGTSDVDADVLKKEASSDVDSGGKESIGLNNTSEREQQIKEGQKHSLGDEKSGDQISLESTDYSESSPTGDSNGIKGENGKEPISQEQLKRFEEIGKAASTALDSLKGLLGDNFSLQFPS